MDLWLRVLNIKNVCCNETSAWIANAGSRASLIQLSYPFSPHSIPADVSHFVRARPFSKMIKRGNGD